MLCRKTEVVPIECIARGYITGSGWKDYQRTGAVCGIPLPDGTAQQRPAGRAAVHAVHQGRNRAR
jgi:phosphoribosylaminoimidazole-succinocarboxamide synthase